MMYEAHESGDPRREVVIMAYPDWSLTWKESANKTRSLEFYNYYDEALDDFINIAKRPSFESIDLRFQGDSVMELKNGLLTIDCVNYDW